MLKVSLMSKLRKANIARIELREKIGVDLFKQFNRLKGADKVPDEIMSKMSFVLHNKGEYGINIALFL